MNWLLTLFTKMYFFSLFFIFCFSLNAHAASLSSARGIVGLGQGAIFDDDQIATFKIGYEFTPLNSFWNIRPLVQAIATDTGAYHVSLGALKEFSISEKWYWGFSTSVGYYEPDNSVKTKELGSGLEFYSAMSISYSVTNTFGVRGELGHISNAGFGKTNPGSEAILLSLVYSF